MSPVGGKVCQFSFSLYSVGTIPISHGANDVFTSTIGTGQFTAATFFSDVVKDVKFNYGKDDFDVIVQQWDNYGKYLDKSGDNL